MAAFEHGKLSSKFTVKVTSALCAVWGILLAGITALALKFNIPFDIIAQPLFSVECLSVVVCVVHGLLMILSSARQDARFKLSNALRTTFGLIFACIIFHMLAVLFGAPMLESSRETFHFAMLMTSLVAVPAFCVLGADGDKWTRVFALGRPALGKETVIYITSVSSMLGAWLGAVPIPLDWDRPWQVWPVSCVVGALMGHCVGLLGSAVYLPLTYRHLCKAKLT
ncbi:GPI ethanolamine phosphate transferase, stabilizing subunit-like [Babylonia areolata]|uniref:GPI ethanolamine phosphate transferase, stabilizing subunit-like n=1 Tax=Babylonia areolata TaxID=304850 RepID=UPI003FCF25E3